MKFFYCKKCLMPSTRPRITFNEEGVCNACQWAEVKRTSVDWSARWKELEELCDKHRCTDGSDWDIIVPCSGGKDSYHIAWNIKHKLNMHPLLVTLSPLLPTEIGRKNLQNLIGKGFDLIQIHPNGEVYRRLHKKGFIEQGRPQLAFVTGITTAVLKIAVRFNVPFVMYGEEGESEYGGRMDYAHKAQFDRKWTVDIYFSGRDTSEYIGEEFTKEDLKWWDFPSSEELEKAGVFLAHWSYFENWDHRLHYKTAREKLELQPVKVKSIEDGVTGFATYTDFTSLDDPFMRTLHTYLMFLKFGFGRGSQEATCDIRVGQMTREEGIELVKKYDAYDCRDFRDKILRVFEMTEAEYQQVIDKWANKALLEKVDGRWQLKKELGFHLDMDHYVEVDYDG